MLIVLTGTETRAGKMRGPITSQLSYAVSFDLAPRSLFAGSKDLLVRFDSLLKDLYGHFYEIRDEVEALHGLDPFEKKLLIDQRIDVQRYAKEMGTVLAGIRVADRSTQRQALKKLIAFIDWTAKHYQYKPVQMFIAMQIERSGLFEKLKPVSLVWNLYTSRLFAPFRSLAGLIFDFFYDRLPIPVIGIRLMAGFFTFIDRNYRDPFRSLDTLIRSNPQSDAYGNALFDLIQSHRIDILPELYEYWNSLDESNPKKKSIEYLLTEIPQWEITAEGTGDWSRVGRTTFENRYSETLDPVIVSLIERMKTGEKLNVFSVADSDMITAYNLQERFDSMTADIDYLPSDLTTRIYLVRVKKDGEYEGEYYAIDSSGKPLTGYRGNPLNKPYHPLFSQERNNPVARSFQTASIDLDRDVSDLLHDSRLRWENDEFEIRTVSLNHPRVQLKVDANAMLSPVDFDILAPPKDLERKSKDIVIARGVVAYNENMDYWTPADAKQILVNLGNLLNEGGFLVLGLGGFGVDDPHLFDIYRRSGNRIEALNWDEIRELLKDHPLFEGNIGNPDSPLTKRLLQGWGYYSGHRVEDRPQIGQHSRFLLRDRPALGAVLDLNHVYNRRYENLEQFQLSDPVGVSG
jgi:hypothetical protein